jgi:hypothetical protein
LIAPPDPILERFYVELAATAVLTFSISRAAAVV